MSSLTVVSIRTEARNCLPALPGQFNGGRPHSITASVRHRRPTVHRLTICSAANAPTGPGREQIPGSPRKLSPAPARAFLESETQRGLKPTVPKTEKDSSEELNEDAAPEADAALGSADKDPESTVSEPDNGPKGSLWGAIGTFFLGPQDKKGDTPESVSAETTSEDADVVEGDKHEVLSAEEDEEEGEVNLNVQMQFIAAQAEAVRSELVAVKARLDDELELSSSLVGQARQRSAELDMTKERMVSLQASTLKTRLKERTIIGQLEEAVNKTTTLEEQQAKLQDELRQARKRIVVEAKGRKALSAEGARLRSQLSNSKADLHSMAYKLDIEKAASLEKDEAIAMLKSELDNSINTFEEEQDKSKKLNMDMIRMQRALSNVQSEKKKLSERVEVLSDRIKNAESRAKRYQGELVVERGTRTEITAAVVKLREVISTVQAEKQQAVQAATGLAQQLGQEKAARAHVEQMVSVMQRELEGVQNGTHSNADKAEAALQAFRDEIAQMNFNEANGAEIPDQNKY